MSYTGVDQTTPILASNFFDSTDTGNTLTISLTTASDGWAMISGANADAAYVASTNTDTLRCSYSGLADSADSNNDITAGTFDTQMTHSGTRGGGGIAIAILPAGGATTTIKTYNSALTANVKTVLNGTVIANRKTWNGIV